MNKPIASISFAVIAALSLAACSREPAAPAAPKAEQETPAPVQPSQTNAQSFSIGQFTGVALLDGGLEFPNDNKTVGVGKTPEEVAQVLSANGLPTDKISLTIHPLLVKTTDRVLLFDTGAGANFGPSAGGLMKSMAEGGIDAGSVTDIFISHPHGDHVGGLVNAEGALVFPNATIHIAKADWAFLQGLTAETAASVGLDKYEAVVAAMSPKVAAFEPNADLLPGAVKAVEIRGHTPGHSGFLISSGDSSLLYIGDSMHHFVVSVQKPDWTIAFDRDAPTAEKSRIELLEKSAASGQRIYAVHFPYPGLGKFEKRAEGFVWVAE
ncbi:MAG TPA: MBL fold metallo-hydrolase [Steroidobacter sp.]|uniref:MBL fold metallo-hydrolase n=1 Tax=Steroidobacter sp. TaxID=1978227 RepID=UPI002ED8DEA0